MNLCIPHNRRTPLQAEEALGPISITRGSRGVQNKLNPIENCTALNARLLAETQVCHRSYIIAAILFLNPRRGLLKFQIYYCYFAFKYNLRHQNHLEGQRNYHLSP